MELIKGKISVILPVYNAENYLQEMLDDLVNQSYQAMEIIIIDDGSTDGSAGIIQEFETKDDRIQFIQTENGGVSRARNIGLEIAKGEYIRFVDADDRIPKDSMSNMLNVYKMNMDIDLVIGNYVTDKKQGYFTGIELEMESVNAKEFAEIFIDYVKSFYFGVPWNKLYKRSIIEKYKIRFDESIIWCEDFLFNVEYYSKCKMLYFLNLPKGIYQYCTRETGITSNIKYRDLGEINQIDDLRYSQMKKYCAEYGLLNRFEIEWKYADLYEKLLNMTKYFRNDNIWTKYNKFVDYICEEGVYQYICIKWEKTNFKVWRLLKEAREKNKYMKVFLFFIFKGFHSKYVGKIFSGIKKGGQEGEMKKL